MNKIKLSKRCKILRELYLQKRDNELLLVAINLNGGLQKIGIMGALND